MLEASNREKMEKINQTEDKRTIGWINWNKEFKQKKLTDTLKITYDLFKEGKLIQEIMKLRGHKQDSIERQIVELITLSKINVDDVIGIEKRKLIFKNITKENCEKLSEIKEKLQNDASWFEIKCVLAHINSKK